MKKRSETEWQELIAEYNKSGQRQAEWCKSKDINLHTFRYRKKRLSKKEGKEPQRVKWLPVEQRVKASDALEVLTVKIGDFTIPVGGDFNEELLLRVCKALRRL